MNYYKCTKCDYIAKQKIDIIRHLNRKTKCYNKNDDTYEYNLSLIKHNIYEDLGLIIKLKDKSFECKNCKKNFHNKSNLNRHLNSINKCNTIELEEKNKNLVVGFEEEWLINNIPIETKLQLVLSESKFTNTLKCILSIEQNCNVFLKDNSLGIIYKSKFNQYEAMSVREILEITMSKLFNLLCNIINELNNENLIGEDIINIIKNKYNSYKKNIGTKKEVNVCLISIYEENKIRSLKKIMDFIK